MIVIAMLVCCPVWAAAATFTVNSTIDDVDATPGDGVGDACEPVVNTPTCAPGLPAAGVGILVGLVCMGMSICRRRR